MSELLKHTRIGPLEMGLLALAILIPVIVVLRWIGEIMRRGAERTERERQAAERAAAARARPADPSRVERHVEKERIVERQVLVMRCAFCKKLTPADLSACAECGAKL